MSVRCRLRGIAGAATLITLCAIAGCQPAGPAAATVPATTAATAPAATTATATPPASKRPARARDVTAHDLAADESMGGHTLARHVGRTDAELAGRLRREPHISTASTYADRATAEQAVGAALASGGRRLASWQGRSGRRPNLVLHYTAPSGAAPLGRSLSRGARDTAPAFRALVVLRWDERRDRSYVLTSYPEAGR